MKIDEVHAFKKWHSKFLLLCSIYTDQSQNCCILTRAHTERKMDNKLLWKYVFCKNVVYV